MTKPIRYPDWALQTYNEQIETEINGVKSTVQVTNKVEPANDYIQFGYTAAKPEVSRQYTNDQLNLIGQWIRYFDSKIQ